MQLIITGREALVQSILSCCFLKVVNDVMSLQVLSPSGGWLQNHYRMVFSVMLLMFGNLSITYLYHRLAGTDN